MLGSIVVISTQNLRHWVSACWEARSWSLALVMHCCCGSPGALSRNSCAAGEGRLPGMSPHNNPTIPINSWVKLFVLKDLPPQKKAHQATLLLCIAPSAWADYKGYIFASGFSIGTLVPTNHLGTGVIQDMDAGSSSCGRCPAGTWNNGSGSVCNQCPAGTWGSEDMEWKSGFVQALEVY